MDAGCLEVGEDPEARLDFAARYRLGELEERLFPGAADDGVDILPRDAGPVADVERQLLGLHDRGHGVETDPLQEYVN